MFKLFIWLRNMFYPNVYPQASVDDTLYVCAYTGMSFNQKQDCNWVSDIQIVWAGCLLVAENIHRPIRLFPYWKSFSKLFKCVVLWSFGSLTPSSLVCGRYHFRGIYSCFFKVQLYVPLKQWCTSSRQLIIIIQKIKICICTALKTLYLQTQILTIEFF
jgi:hypothetical protein